MAANRVSKLNIVALVLLATAAIGFVFLGRWQLSRAAERNAISAAIEKGRAGEPVLLSGQTPAEQLQAWRPAQAEGVWRPEFSFLLDNRNLDGRPGLWLATPLMLADGKAVLVLRGWFARPLGEALSPKIKTPQTAQMIRGELSQHVPRLFEVWTGSGRAEKGFPEGWPEKNESTGQSEQLDKLIRLQNVELSALSAQTGLQLLPVVLMQNNEVNDGLKRIWPEPSLDADKNIGYAMQWFGFAGIAVAIWLGLLWRLWRGRRRAPSASNSV